MAKLHELLAVENDLEGTYRKILNETVTTFTKKTDHFLGQIRTLELFDAEAKQHAPETKTMDTTVQDKLDYQNKHIVRYLDAVLQKELTNGIARADIVIDGKVIAQDLPATFLLGLETKLKHIRETYSQIPTLAPGIEWVKDEKAGTNVYKTAKPDEKFQTKTIVKPFVIYEATKEHPAQVREISEVVDIGKYERTITSGMISSADKTVLLGKIDKLIRATKKARQRANSTKVIQASVGNELINYIES